MLILRITPLFGILAFFIGIPLQNFRVETVQSNGLPYIYYPLWGLGIVAQLLGLGLIIFGVLFNFSPVRLMGVRRAVTSSVLVAAGATLVVPSGLGIWVNYEYEWGVHFCSEPQPYPVCGSIFWLIVEFSVLALIGVSLVLSGRARGSKKVSSAGQIPPSVLGQTPAPANRYDG